MSQMAWAKKKKVALSLVLIAWAITVPVFIASIALSPPPADLYLRMYPGETSSFTVRATNLSDSPINTTVTVMGIRQSPSIEQIGPITWRVIQPHENHNFTITVRLMPPEHITSERWVIAYLYGANESLQLLSPAIIALGIFKIVAIITSLTR